MSFIDTIKDIEVNQFSEMINTYSSFIDDYKKGNLPYETFLSKLHEFESLDINNQNVFNRMLAYYVLGSSYTAIKYKTINPESVDFDSEIKIKELYYYRKASEEVVEIQKNNLPVVRWRDMAFSLLVNLGNCYDHSGRFSEALQFYDMAIDIFPTRKQEALFHKLFTFANTYSYYSESPQQVALVFKAKKELPQFIKRKEFASSAMLAYNLVKNLDSKDVDKENLKFKDTVKDIYREWILKNRLMLNRYNDVRPMSKLSATDSLFIESLFMKKNEMGDGLETLFTMFNEIKQEFVSARYMLYKYMNDRGKQHFSDKDVSLIEIDTKPCFSYNLELAKASFRILYSILDKIAFFLNKYLKLDINENSISFNTIWYENKRILRASLKNMNNLSLLALYSIRNDIYDIPIKTFLPDNGALLLKNMRNAVEHRTIVITNDSAPMYEEKDGVFQIERSLFENKLLKMAQIVRCAIIYLCNLVMNNENDKKNEHQKNMEKSGFGIIVDDFYPNIQDKDKI